MVRRDYIFYLYNTESTEANNISFPQVTKLALELWIGELEVEDVEVEGVVVLDCGELVVWLEVEEWGEEDIDDGGEVEGEWVGYPVGLVVGEYGLSFFANQDKSNSLRVVL